MSKHLYHTVGPIHPTFKKLIAQENSALYKLHALDEPALIGDDLLQALSYGRLAFDDVRITYQILDLTLEEQNRLQIYPGIIENENDLFTSLNAGGVIRDNRHHQLTIAHIKEMLRSRGAPDLGPPLLL